ncbi:uncharacterized protein LOC125201479 [Salvia hispanica]|uniref:uncharacterized protein LOC125201479 n=1 Tax=Salvia hispanica TaxID=49212 RepID=UPI0020099F4A|nr:uncharacterized protein LOC125201479 [Salvia hispanica]
MEGMRDIARSYYDRASEAEKKSIKQSFAKLDINGDGRINFREFKKSVSSWLREAAVFKQFDKNGDGSLDFDEFLCLHYMEKKVDIAKCSACSELLVGPYFSCLLCLGRGKDTYDLCCACYRRRRGWSHEHPVQHMMDHHSLLMLLKDRTAGAEKAQHKKEMEELREVAKAHYHSSPPHVQALAHKFYRSMDSDGDGRVDVSEFLDFMRHEGYSCMENPCFFDDLDVDRNGTLDFFEVMTLYYIIKSGRPFCDCCDKFIPGLFFSCVECYKNGRSSFDLCRDCYGKGRCDHNHGGRVHFLDNHTLLQAMKDSTLAPAPRVTYYEAGNTPTYEYDMYQSNSIWSNVKDAYEALDTIINIGMAVTTTLGFCTIM